MHNHSLVVCTLLYLLSLHYRFTSLRMKYIRFLPSLSNYTQSMNGFPEVSSLHGSPFRSGNRYVGRLGGGGRWFATELATKIQQAPKNA